MALAASEPDAGAELTGVETARTALPGIPTIRVAPTGPAQGTEPDVVAGRGRAALHFLGMVLSATLLMAVLGLFGAVIVVPKIVGTTPLTVLTSSMEPGLPPGTLIILQPVEPDALEIGDVATYQIRSGEPGVVTHRVTAVNLSDQGRTYQFTGDNNSVADEEAIRPEQIQGKLWYSIPYIGYLNNLVHGAGTSWVIPTLAIGLLVYAVFMIGGFVVSATRYGKSQWRRRATPAQQ